MFGQDYSGVKRNFDCDLEHHGDVGFQFVRRAITSFYLLGVGVVPFCQRGTCLLVDGSRCETFWHFFGIHVRRTIYADHFIIDGDSIITRL